VYLNSNFYDYLNRYRVIYACQLLRDANCQWRVLDIAFESGFSNKNSFYRYFRDTYNMTPVEYRNRHVGASLKVVG
jgi:AraC-like DNA-binding protein